MADGTTVRELFATLGLDVDEKAFKAADFLMDSLKGKLAEIGLLLGGAAIVGGLAALGKSTADAGIHAYKTAQALGITTDAVQELENVADEALISTEELEQGLKFLARNAAEAANGGKEMATVFRALGIQLDPKNLPPVDQLLERVADAFKNTIPETQKTNVAMKLFGRSGAQLVGTLNLGSERIRELRMEAHELGIVLDGSAIESSLEFGRAIRQLEDHMKALKYTIGVPVLKALNALIGGLLKVVGVVKGFFKGEFPKAMAIFRVALIAAVLALGAFAVANAAAIGTAIASWYTMAAVAVSSAAAIVASWIAAAAPFIPFALAVLVAAVALEDLYGFITGKRSVIGDFINQWSLAGKQFTGIRGKLEALGRTLAFVLDMWAALTGNAGGNLAAFDFLTKHLANLPDAINRASNVIGLDVMAPASPQEAARRSVASSVGGAGADALQDYGLLPGSPVSVNISVTPLPGMDEQALAEFTARQFTEQLGKINRIAKAAIP